MIIERTRRYGWRFSKIIDAMVVGGAHVYDGNEMDAARRELWDALGEREGRTMEFYFPAPWLNAKVIELVRLPEMRYKELRNLMEQFPRDKVAAGFIGEITERPE